MRFLRICWPLESFLSEVSIKEECLLLFKLCGRSYSYTETTEFCEDRYLPTDSCVMFFFLCSLFLGSRMTALWDVFLPLAWIFSLCIPFKGRTGHFQNHRDTRDTIIWKVSTNKLKFSFGTCSITIPWLFSQLHSQTKII